MLTILTIISAIFVIIFTMWAVSTNEKFAKLLKDIALRLLAMFKSAFSIIMGIALLFYVIWLITRLYNKHVEPHVTNLTFTDFLNVFYGVVILACFLMPIIGLFYWIEKRNKKRSEIEDTTKTSSVKTEYEIKSDIKEHKIQRWAALFTLIISAISVICYRLFFNSPRTGDGYGLSIMLPFLIFSIFVIIYGIYTESRKKRFRHQSDITRKRE